MKLRRWFRYYYLRIKRTRDHPASIAKGISFGVAVDFLPTFGTGLVFAYILASIFKANRVAAVGTAILLKWAIPFLYVANYTVGQLVLGQYLDPDQPIAADLSELFEFGGWEALSASFLLGSLINAAAAALLTYYLTYRLINRRRSRSRKTRISHSYID